MPVWIDIFGNEIQKSKWLTLNLLSAPLGIVSGYILCAVLQNTSYGW
jgi:hypothetical protein